MDVVETVIVAVVSADGDSGASGDSEGAAVGVIFGDDVGNAWDDVARRSLENGISAIRATIIGTATAATTSRIYEWEGPGPNVELTRTTETRMPSEQKWYNLTGRVVGLKVEADGDIHIALEDATANRVGTVSAEIPVGQKWCEIRQTVFGWTLQSFPSTSQAGLCLF